MTFRALTLIVMMSVALSGCASGPALVGGPDVRVLNTTELPPPNHLAAPNGERPYLLGPFDRVSVMVFGAEDLSSKEVQADASGRISVPLVGTLEAAGKTPGELAALMEQRLRGYVRNPQVSVNLIEAVSNVVTVDGQVREPGLYPVVGRMTLMRAVSIAKGATEFARLTDVVVFRTVDNQQLAALYNLDAIRKGMYKDPEIYANDVVVVGDSQARRLFKDILQITPLITTPLVTLLAYRR